MKQAKIGVLSVILVVLTCLSSCWDRSFPYSGDRMDLAATAIHSIPGVDSDVGDQIVVLEEDEYGRVLFAACLPDSWIMKDSFDESVLALVVMQNSDETHAWFYGEKNYVVTILTDQIAISKENIGEYFSEDVIAELKKKNDWNLDPDNSYQDSVKVPISLDKDEPLSKVSERIITDRIGSNHRSELLRTDANGKKLYFILNITGPWDNTTHEWYLIALNADGTLVDEDNSILRFYLHQLPNLASIVEEFCDQNSWEDVTT